MSFFINFVVLVVSQIGKMDVGWIEQYQMNKADDSSWQFLNRSNIHSQFLILFNISKFVGNKKSEIWNFPNSWRNKIIVVWVVVNCWTNQIFWIGFCHNPLLLFPVKLLNHMFNIFRQMALNKCCLYYKICHMLVSYCLLILIFMVFCSVLGVFTVFININ